MGTHLLAGSSTSGDYSFDYSNGNNIKHNNDKFNLGLIPTVGVFVSDHLVFGGALDIGYDHKKTSINNANSSTPASTETVSGGQYSIGPFIRYYFFDTNPSKTVFFGEVVTGLGTGNGNTTESSSKAAISTFYTAKASNMFLFNAYATLGVTHFVSNTIGIDAAVNYLYMYQRYTSNYDSQTTNSNGIVNNKPGSFTATLPQNRFSLTVGVHLFLPLPVK